MSISNKKLIQPVGPYFADTVPLILKDIEKAIESGQLTQGEFLPRFESDFSKYTNTKHALGVSSGGTALELILKSIGVVGKEVIVPTDTFVATANAVLLAGGTPKFADFSAQTLALNAKTVEPLINDNTVAVIIVHMFGLIPSDIFELKDLCEKRGIHLIEDAAHAHGASISGMPAGSIGLAGAFSFYPTKILTTGEGGIISTNDDKLANNVRIIRNHGKSLTEPVFVEISNNYRLSEIQAILGVYQTKLLAENIKLRRTIADKYRSALGDLNYLELLPAEADSESNVFWRFPLILNKGVNRIDMQNCLDTNYGVRITWMYEPLCHQQPVFIKYCNTQSVKLPVAEEYMSRLICLPCYPGLTEEQIDTVITSIIDYGDKI